MSPITAQGLNAEATVAAEVEKAMAEIRERVSTVEVSPSELVAELPFKPDVVREAMWQLLDSKSIRLTSTRHLQST
jgi:hypothetical protein